MKNSVLYILLLAIACCFSACHLFPQTVTRPIPDIESGPISLDFDYTNSITKSGWVRFMDLSEGIEDYEWDFGFQENGASVKSYTGAPKIRFPSNGHYNVKLVGISYKDDTLTVTKSVVVSNY
ncbi:PKD domain-containing protein [Fulvivirga lutimaris]|uniref:PKD domain-containing protein n=1 Tax=Fulvivirga lutimaris TaxID=1819566 RepID=UPI0012BBF728|nr:PKD domain-containing protein [Fulvivirga lutimaris]